MESTDVSGMDTSPRRGRGNGSRRRANSQGADSGGARNAAYAPALNVVTSVPARNPYDEPAFPDEQIEEPGEIFPNLFDPTEVTDSVTGEEVQHVWNILEKLINKELEKRTPPAAVVRLVKQFYDEKILQRVEGAPAWSEYNVYRYIFNSPIRQADDNINAIQTTIEFLRNNLAVQTDDATRPHTENIKLLMSAVKTHATLVDMKRKRDQHR